MTFFIRFGAVGQCVELKQVEKPLSYYLYDRVNINLYAIMKLTLKLKINEKISILLPL
jgi:hypothetical protein